MECCKLPAAELALGRRLRCRGIIESEVAIGKSVMSLYLVADNGEKYIIAFSEVLYALMELVGEELEVIGTVCNDELGNFLLTVQSYRTCSN